MLDKDNIISTNVSEAVEKIPTDEKDYRKCSFVFYFVQPKSKIQLTHRKSCFPTRMHPVQLKKITEDILNKIYTEKGTITGI